MRQLIKNNITDFILAFVVSIIYFLASILISCNTSSDLEFRDTLTINIYNLSPPMFDINKKVDTVITKQTKNKLQLIIIYKPKQH